MRKLLTTIFLALVACLSVKAELKAGGEYYIWLNIYEKLLGSNEAGSGPALSAYGVNSDSVSYVFVAESTEESGYFLLRQKSSGKYLAGSSNGYDVTLEAKSTANRFLWKMTGTDCYAYLTNKNKSSNFVGIDGAKKSKSYVNIYYDKRKSSHGQFSVIPAVGSSWDDARQAYKSSVYKNAQDIQEIDYCQLNDKTIDCSDAIDIHITSNDNPMLGSSTVNLGSDRTWLIFDNIVPSQVISKYLQYVTINGETAQKDVNCRVAIYLNGAAVIPLPDVVMACEGTEGHFELAVGNYTNLAELEPGQSNTMTSFTLRRGYMATLACGTNGSWYSRVFVADHKDLEVTLPTAMMKRVSSANVKPWQYVSKKGWANTKGSTGGPGLRATWYWSWSAGYNHTTDMEYVPCRQHLYWPSASEVNDKTWTASLSFNEPDHSEQHEDCSCGGTTTASKDFEFNKEFQAGGGRIGSPQPQDYENFSFLNTYFGLVDNNSYSRCDIAAIHDYLDLYNDNAGKVYSADEYAKYVTDTYWNLWNSTKRPIWLTEMEVGSSLDTNTKSTLNTDDKAREYLQALLQRLEESDYIERYAIYGYDWWHSYMYWDANVSKGLTPAGEVYRDHRSTFGYNANYIKVPNWSKPNAQKPTLEYSVNLEDRTIVFTIKNPNGDSTDGLVIEHKPNGGNWQTLIAFDDNRSLLESNTVTMTVSFDDVDAQGETFRVTSTTLYGGSSTSNEVTGPVISELESLPELIAEAETHQVGFECGEYAPYNNVEVLKALAVVKAMNPNAANFSEACQTLAKAKWVVNTEEVDAVYDGTFAHAVNNGAPAGWTMSNGSLGGDYHSRAFVGDNRLSEFNDTKSGFFIRFDDTYSNRGSLYYYGRTEGYTMPLKEGAKYRLTVDAKGWNSTGKPLVLRVTGPSGFTAVDQQITTASKAETDNNKPQQFVIDFTATVAGNYEFYFQCPGSEENKHRAIVSNISLRRIVEKGDVDGSGGKPNVDDVKALVKRMLGQTPDGFVESAADVDGNGVVNITDVTKLIEMILSTQ